MVGLHRKKRAPWNLQPDTINYVQQYCEILSDDLKAATRAK
jgi:hypothetical protein